MENFIFYAVTSGKRTIQQLKLETLKFEVYDAVDSFNIGKFIWPTLKLWREGWPFEYKI